MKPERQYLENQILNASKEQLLLMLFDGAIRFAGQARAKLDEKDFEAYGNLLVRAQNIMLELIGCLKEEELGRDLAANLAGLYHFVYQRLLKAGLRKDPVMIAEALKVLASLRETWALAIEKDLKERFPELAKVRALAQEHSVPAPAPLNLQT